jgi:putative hydrolase of HD superfamily
MDEIRFKNQLDFIIEADKVKNILRRTKIFDGSRFENDAEHSWTVCLMAVLLKEYSNYEINIEKVLVMLLIHDIVEIGAGDTFLYSKERDSAYKNENTAARQIFGILPSDQSQYFYNIWKEFEERKTNESKFASVFDRFEPILQNYKTEGYTWKKHGITKSMVLEKNKHIADGSTEIWNFFLALIDECVKKGYLENS